MHLLPEWYHNEIFTNISVDSIKAVFTQLGLSFLNQFTYYMTRPISTQIFLVILH